MAYHIIYCKIIMSNHNSSLISESEQMYLITIARSMEEGGPTPLPLSHIAHKLSLQPVSVNQMVRKLEGEGLVHYHPYKGVELTEQGQSLREADAMACDLEHVTPEDISRRLSDFLNHPAVGPGGEPIPSLEGDEIQLKGVTLSELEVGTSAHIIETNSQTSVSRFLISEGLRPGEEITLAAIGTQGARLIATNRGYVEITKEIADAIFLLPVPNPLLEDIYGEAR
jgi:DtxR family Mn-dependent transcriptional regulator